MRVPPERRQWTAEHVRMRLLERSEEVARERTGRLDLCGCLVGLDAIHTQTETARALVQEAGADYLLTVKDNQKGLKRTLGQLLAPARAGASRLGRLRPRPPPVR